MRKTVSAAAMAAALTVGGATGVALFVPEGANAQTDPTTETAPDPATDGPATDDPARPDRGAFLAETLAPLVADGTIDQTQADAVIAAIEAARPDGRPGMGHDRRGGPAGLPGGGVVADALGLSPEELRTALTGGQTIAEIADDNGIAVEDVEAALLAENDERLAAAVDAGRLSQDEADAKRADAEERVGDLLDGSFEPGDDGRGGPEHRGPDGEADREATDS